MPDGKDVANGEKLDSTGVMEFSLVRENVSCQSLARESSIQASNAASLVGPRPLSARKRALRSHARHLQ